MPDKNTSCGYQCPFTQGRQMPINYHPRLYHQGFQAPMGFYLVPMNYSKYNIQYGANIESFNMLKQLISSLDKSNVIYDEYYDNFCKALDNMRRRCAGEVGNGVANSSYYGLISEEPLYKELLRQGKVKLSGDMTKDFQKILKKSHKYLRKRNKDYRGQTKWRSSTKRAVKAMMLGMTFIEFYNQRSMTDQEFLGLRNRVETSMFRNPSYLPDYKRKGSARKAAGSVASGIRGVTALSVV